MAGDQTVAQQNLTCAIRIRERRRQLGLTQAEVVARVSGHGSHLSSQTLSAIENGRRLDVGRLPGLAGALECTVSYLLGLTADPGRWIPDDVPPPAGRRPAREVQPTRDPQTAPEVQRSGEPAGPNTNGIPGRAAPPHRSWILGPDVPDSPALSP